MVYEPKGNQSCCDGKNGPDCVNDFIGMSKKSRFFVVALSIILIGGGTVGCLYFAGAFHYSVAYGELNSSSLRYVK